MIERRLTFFVLWVFLTTLFILVLRAQGWATGYDLCSGSVFDDVQDRNDPRCTSIARESVAPPCEQRMEQAMRAMEEFVNPDKSYSTYDGCNTCTFNEFGGGSCTLAACTRKNEVAVAEWELKRAKERAAVAERQHKAREQWNAVKTQCWGKP